MNISMKYVYLLITKNPITDGLGVAIIFDKLSLCFNVFPYKPSGDAVMITIGELRKLVNSISEAMNTDYQMRDFGHNFAIINFLSDSI
ncbi:hypothetical protein GFS03_05080 [Sulfolobus sp. E5-1-F]|uniref:hypothetical protein n=1 Tax=Saccharolobus sp. E5-1-F TaxID=2663019 RepID=UPI001297554E|nr:hypothetical protein [Sulfolobus sp. E5-1-F]QGA53992.1 hypothetical protein GFS03_05080 [Sulfolobus sp. E5-1-F]